MDAYGFVYIWRDKKYNRYYIGSHWGSEDDGYICSSSWMKNSFKRRPHEFKRKILSRIYTNKKDLLDKENLWLKLIKNEELKIRYYNLRNVDFNHWSIHQDLSLTTRQKMSEARKGKKHTYESKLKMSESHKGKIHTEQTKIKMSNSKQHISEEYRRKMSLAKIGKKWYNNGIVEVRCNNKPDNFNSGRLINNKRIRGLKCQSEQTLQ